MVAPSAMIELEGIPVSGGSRIGRAVVYEEARGVAIPLRPAGPVEEELERLAAAVDEARAGLERLHESLGGDRSIGEIFRFHAEVLEQVQGDMQAAIRDGASAEHAVARVMHDLAGRFLDTGNAMLSQRSRDVVDLERRLLAALGGREIGTVALDGVDGPVVVVARDLTPSQTASLEGRDVAAIVLEEGGATSHSAVIAKSLGIPCVVGVAGLAHRIAPGVRLWVDGTRGRVVIEPDEEAMARARGIGERYERLEASLLRESHLPAETLDGHRATLLANVEFPLDVAAAAERGAEGVGLYRTEYLYDEQEGLPDEQRHVEAYREVLARLDGRRLTVRTFDFGADKHRPRETGDREPNPALGVRSLRWCFAHPDVFLIQLRALLRVAAEGDVRIMLPMVGSLEELRRARGMIRQAASELAAEGLAHRADPPVGVMIEIPGAAITADLLAREVDFFSIGTNDLIQYDLAVDRVNPRVASLFRPSHPSLLRLLQQTIQAAARAGIPVTMCGEMGGHSIYTVLLMGMGLREFSLTPGYLPRVRRLLRSLTLRRARSVAAQCLRLATADEIEALLRARVPTVGAG